VENKTSRDIILWYFLALFFISIYLLGKLFWPFISIIVMAAVVTGFFNPLYNYLNKKIRHSAVASVITCGVVFFVLFIPIVFFVGVLANEAHSLYIMSKGSEISNKIKILLQGSSFLEKTNYFLANFNIQLTGEELNKALTDIGRVVGLFIYEQASSIASNLFKLVINFFLMLLVIYYLFLDGSKLISFIIELSPLPKEQDEKLIKKFKDMASAILVGNGFCGLIQGFSGGLVFYFFDLKSPIMWGAIMALLAFLPIIGIGIVLIPAAVFLLLQGKIASGIFFIVFYIILSGGIEYILKPKVVGQRVKMHTLITFFSIIGGLKLFGILGIIYGPIIITAFLTLTDIYHSSYQQKVHAEY